MRLVLIALTILLAMPCSIEAFAVTKSFAAKQLPRTAAFAAPKLTKDENKAATTTATATTTTTTPPTTTALQLLENASRAAAGTATVWVATAQTALADSPDWGLFEGRIGSLLHPAMMASMFVFSISTAILGWQWRRQRTMGDEISALKKTLPDLQGAASVSAALSAAKSAETVDTNRIQTLTAALVTEQQISALVTERKSLAEAGPRDKHYSQGALLAFLGTIFAIEGPLNTYARAGKLFPGPHLYAGAGLVCLWALAATCVPAMQKGNDNARFVHIGANIAGIGLFGWQVSSGIPILLKVIENTSWP